MQKSTATMQLMMFIGNDLIESVPLELDRISIPGYVGSFKRNLKIKYSDLIKQHPESTEFLVYEPAAEPPKQASAHTR